MEIIDQYTQEIECEYKDERYKVRDNGAVFRLSQEGKKPRKLDNTWTFGTQNADGYMTIASHRVHIIVATAFHGSRDSKVYVVDHIDTNRANNRVENLRWLTKLENILLNPITKSKIEYICGSVENFLNNPSLLRGNEMQDKNFSWMREVTKEEAENTLANWKKLMDNPRPKPSTGGIGEWIYQPSTKTIPTRLDESSSLHGTLYERLKIEEEQRKREEARQREERRQQRLQKEAEKKLKQKKLKDDIKSIAKEVIISFAETIDAQLYIDAKGEGWKADFLLTINNKKYAFLLYRTTNKIDEQLEAFRKAEINPYWLGSESQTRFYSELYPSFQMDLRGGSLSVYLSTQFVSVNTFLSAIINDKLIQTPNIVIDAVKIRFCALTCWNCNKQHNIYFVNGIRIKDNPDIFTYEKMYDRNLEVDEQNPIIYKSVTKYLAMHPELNYQIGEIKNRYSKTREGSYLSFGCPICDAIVGNHYLSNIKFDYIYEKDDEDVHFIELTEPIEIASGTKNWCILDN